MTATLTTPIQATPLPGLKQERLAIGMADMDGFMNAVEGGSDADIAALVEATYGALGDAIVRHGGRIWKYLGDAILYSNPDPAGAARAAHEIAALRFRSRDKEVRFHVSVATGTVVRGVFGHGSLRGEDIFGHTIHRAAMMGRDAKADPSHVALDEATRRASESP